MGWRLGFDIGGTFTDFVLQDVATGAIVIGKHLTTPHDPSAGVFLGLADLLRAAGADLREVHQALHGTTLGANLVIERKGAKTFLVTTRGFRDVLEIQRQLRYTMRSEIWTTVQFRPHSPRGEFERGGGPPLSVGPAGRAPRLPRPEPVEGCKRGSLPRERSVAGGRSTLLPRR